MRYDIHKHDVQITPQIEKIIGQKIAKLDKRLETYHPDAAHLELQIRHAANDRIPVQCALTLRGFHEALHVEKTATELREAVDHAFDALYKELEHYRARVNKSLQPNLPKTGES